MAIIRNRSVVTTEEFRLVHRDMLRDRLCSLPTPLDGYPGPGAGRLGPAGLCGSRTAPHLCHGAYGGNVKLLTIMNKHTPGSAFRLPSIYGADYTANQKTCRIPKLAPNTVVSRTS